MNQVPDRPVGPADGLDSMPEWHVWVTALLTVLSFNALLTFAAVPSTPWIRPTLTVSLDLVVGLAVIALYRTRHASLSWLARAGVVSLIVAASLTRYAVVITPAVMGRELNARGDLPHVHRVVGMFWKAMPASTAFMVLGTIAVVLIVLVALCWYGCGALERVMAHSGLRKGLVVSALVAACIVVMRADTPEASLFARPMARVIGDQLATYTDIPADTPALAHRPVPGPPEGPASRGMAGLDGADVFLIFLESYGATLMQDEQHFSRIAPRFARLERHLAERGFATTSNLVISPTFGGGSWRAHATVLSGIRLDDERLYEQLIRSQRPTLVHLFKDAGYRTVSAEPGIQRDWPEGRFFGFDLIYDAATLDYSGPDIGWWKIPDQFTLYRMYTEEITKAGRSPLFAKIALIMSHIPYFPVPPYVEDWSRFGTGTAYRQGMPSIAADDYRDLTELSSRYVNAFVYELDILEDFITTMVPDNALVIVSGDHQPPKLATHDNDSWAVPMHLISRRRDLVRPFDRHGFQDGLMPRETSGFRMEDFLPAFLQAFGAQAASSHAGP